MLKTFMPPLPKAERFRTTQRDYYTIKGMEPGKLFTSPLTWRDGEQWLRAGTLLEAAFRGQPSLAETMRRRAEEVRRLLSGLDAFIQERTARLCPACRTVCCRWENCRYDASDLVYLSALGMRVPEFTAGLEETGPCRFLAPTGCVMERDERPFRCTWHFCDALVAYLSDEPQKPVREFSRGFQQLQQARLEMMAVLISGLHGQDGTP
jgi:hypothetical protein